MLAIIFIVYICGRSVASFQSPIITRAAYDFIQFPDCGGLGNGEKFNCNNVMVNGERTGDHRTCSCRCKPGYVTYRDPSISYVRNVGYRYNEKENGCVWYGTYREGCHVLENVDQLKYNNQHFSKPILLDLTQSGNITLQSEHYRSFCAKIVAFVREPRNNTWEKVTNVSFHLEKLKKSSGMKRYFQLKWLPTNASTYSYQGLIMRLDLHECSTKLGAAQHCIMTKIAGTYTDESKCRRRTESGRCCIFPFVYKGTLLNTCVITSDMEEPWCPVSLDSRIKEGDHKWRGICNYSTIASERPFRLPTTTSPLITPSTQASIARTTITDFVNIHNTEAHGSTSQTLNPTFVTVTITAPCQHPTFNASSESERSSGKLSFDIAFIIAISAGLVLIIIGVFIFGVCLCRKKGTKTNQPRNITMSNEDLTYEEPYATSQLRPSPLTNHGFRESIEMTPHWTPGVTRGYIETDPMASNAELDKPDSQPVYSMPEADYSLIVTPSRQSIKSNNRVIPSSCSSSHVYSVLERDNDPLKFPQPIDNDRVFVEFNPLYGSVDVVNEPNANDLGAIYEDPANMKPTEKISDVPCVSEQDV